MQGSSSSTWGSRVMVDTYSVLWGFDLASRSPRNPSVYLMHSPLSKKEHRGMALGLRLLGAVIRCMSDASTFMSSLQRRRSRQASRKASFPAQQHLLSLSAKIIW